MLPLITAIVVFGTILFLILGLISGRSNAGSLARQRLEACKRGGSEPEVGDTERAGFGARVVSPMFGGAARGLGNILPRSMIRSVEKQLVTAGEPMTMNGFLTLVVIATSAAAGFGVLIVIAMGASIGPKPLGAIIGLAVPGFLMPFSIIRSRAKQRQH